MNDYDVIILGGGPAGLAAAISATENGAKALVVERESRLGGILKQCIHDGFGLVHFGERLTGPEYADRFIKKLIAMNIDYMLEAFAINVTKDGNGVTAMLQTSGGIKTVTATTLVLACGCRERTSRQVFIHGDRPAGIWSAGTAQYFVNIMGYMPTKRCVILGSGDIGMIMARRLTLEGATVEGVYEIKDAPAGLARNVAQCLNDYSIPLHLSCTVTRVIGSKRVEAVEVADVGKDMKPIPGTERIIECDALILSVGLLPENEIAESLGVELDSATKGPYVDQCFMTNVDGVFACGNALHVNDLVDYVSQSGILAGKFAASYRAGNRSLTRISYNRDALLYAVPQLYDASAAGEINVYLRSRSPLENKTVGIHADGKELKKKKYRRMIPSEMEALSVTIPDGTRKIEFTVE